MTNFKVGTVTHFYDKIGVAVVDLISDLAVGDKIKISMADNEFEQEVKSMQIEHEQIKTAKKGQTVGLKLEKPVTKKAEIFKIQ